MLLVYIINVIGQSGVFVYNSRRFIRDTMVWQYDGNITQIRSLLAGISKGHGGMAW